jgi:hypothetical protein
MSTAPPVTPAPPAPVKVSWLKKFGHAVAAALGFVAKEAAPIAQEAGAVVAAIEPAFAPEIAVAENLVTKIANQATVTEAAFTAVGQGANGAAKLQAVIDAVGPEIDSWVAAAFPGAKQVSTVAKAGLVNGVVAVLNDVDGNLALTAPTETAAAAATAAKAAVAATKS